jgi:tRNA-2-methylthio-N6-dimethylallyladenosine synthase
MQVRAMGAARRRHFVRTYGCQQNVADGERIKGMLAEMGFAFTDDEDEADFILFNTCAIREHAEDRVLRQHRRAEKREAPQSRRCSLPSAAA